MGLNSHRRCLKVVVVVVHAIEMGVGFGKHSTRVGTKR